MADPYFNRIGKQLIEAPASSCKLLEAAQKGQRPPLPVGAEAALGEARSWAAVILTKPFAPLPVVPFVAFKQEGGVCDVVRAEYTVREVKLAIAQSAHLIAVAACGLEDPAKGSELERVEAAASKLLVCPPPLKFERLEALGEGSCGKRTLPPSGPVDAEWPHWQDRLRYFTTKQGAIGFVTVKASGGPTRGVIGVAEGLNRVWFE
jgi:hypothetical protein